MAYNGPMEDPIKLHYPYEEKDGTPDWSKVIMERGENHPDQAFYRGALIGFRNHPSYSWTIRQVTQVSYKEGTPSDDLASFMTYLDGHKTSTRQLYLNDRFWELYSEATDHPAVLLDIAARQAMESLKGL